MIAASKGHAEVVKVLVRHDANVNAQDNVSMISIDSTSHDAGRTEIVHS